MLGLLSAILEYEEFIESYRFVCQKIENEIGVVAEIDARALDRAYLHWLGLAGDLRWVRASKHFKLVSLIAALITSTSVVEVVRFVRRPSDAISILAHTVCLYPNQVVAFAYGASIFSSVIEDMTGQEPGCGMNPQNLMRAARELKQNSGQAKSFRRLLRLKLPSGRA